MPLEDFCTSTSAPMHEPSTALQDNDEALNTWAVFCTAVRAIRDMSRAFCVFAYGVCWVLLPLREPTHSGSTNDGAATTVSVDGPTVRAAVGHLLNFAALLEKYHADNRVRPTNRSLVVAARTLTVYGRWILEPRGMVQS